MLLQRAPRVLIDIKPCGELTCVVMNAANCPLATSTFTLDITESLATCTSADTNEATDVDVKTPKAMAEATGPFRKESSGSRCRRAGSRAAEPEVDSRRRSSDCLDQRAAPTGLEARPLPEARDPGSRPKRLSVKHVKTDSEQAVAGG